MFFFIYFQGRSYITSSMYVPRVRANAYHVLTTPPRVFRGPKMCLRNVWRAPSKMAQLNVSPPGTAQWLWVHTYWLLFSLNFFVYQKRHWQWSSHVDMFYTAASTPGTLLSVQKIILWFTVHKNLTENVQDPATTT